MTFAFFETINEPPRWARVLVRMMETDSFRTSASLAAIGTTCFGIAKNVVRWKGPLFLSAAHWAPTRSAYWN